MKDDNSAKWSALLVFGIVLLYFIDYWIELYVNCGGK